MLPCCDRGDIFHMSNLRLAFHHKSDNTDKWETRFQIVHRKIDKCF